jgi:hypothetical protein
MKITYTFVGGGQVDAMSPDLGDRRFAAFEVTDTLGWFPRKHTLHKATSHLYLIDGNVDGAYTRVLDALHKHLPYPTEACTIVRAVQQGLPIPEGATGWISTP